VVGVGGTAFANFAGIAAERLDRDLGHLRIALGELRLELVEDAEQVERQQELAAARAAGADAEGEDPTASSTALATGAGTASISKPTAPAASIARPSSTMRIASAAVLPCSLKPP
jgi:hypothetical protein